MTFQLTFVQAGFALANGVLWTGWIGQNWPQTPCLLASVQQTSTSGSSGVPRLILYLDTGTGIWAIETADHYPKSTVIATDFSPVQPVWYDFSSGEALSTLDFTLLPKPSSVPDKIRFEIDNFESKLWPWPESLFHYVHSCFLISSVSSYPALIRKAFRYISSPSQSLRRSTWFSRHCKSGAYLELQELSPHFYSNDGSLKEDSELTCCLRWSTRLPRHTTDVCLTMMSSVPGSQWLGLKMLYIFFPNHHPIHGRRIRLWRNPVSSSSLRILKVSKAFRWVFWRELSSGKRRRYSCSCIR